MFRPLSLLVVALSLVALTVPASAGWGPAGPSWPQLFKPNIKMQSVTVFEHGDVVSVPYIAVTLKNTGIVSTGSFWIYDYTRINGTLVAWPHKTLASGLAAGQTRTFYIQLPYQPIGQTQQYNTLVLPNYDQSVNESSMSDNWFSGVFYK